MSLPLPEIDTVDFDALVEQARLSIPRYAADWTDHNVHDPGMMLIELGAWLADQQSFTTGFVSDEHLEAFAALLGARPEPARPARGLVWPDADAIDGNPTAAGSDLPAGARATIRQQPDIAFRAAATVHLSPARRLAVERHAEPLPSADSAVELLFDRPLVETGTPGMGPIAIGIEIDDVMSEVARADVGGRLTIDYRLEDNLGADPWRRLDVVSDSTSALGRTGVVRVLVPAVALVPGANAKRRSRLRVGTRYRNNPVPPVVRRSAINVIEVEQREITPAALIGVATGHPNQLFDVEFGGFDPSAPPEIDIDENERPVRWSLRESFADAGPDDRVCIYDAIRGRLAFGNGINGRLPPAGAEVRHQQFSVTRGAAGNLAANLDWRIAGATLGAGVERFGTNPRAMTGGADAWDRERLRAAARERAKSRSGLVTNTDLGTFAGRLDALGVANADVRVGFDPARPHADIPNMRTLLVTPRVPLAGSRQRYVSALRRAITPGRVLGERLNVAIVRDRSVDVRLVLAVPDAADARQIRARVRRLLESRLSRVRRSDDVAPWPPGRMVTQAELETLVSGVDDVVAVLACEFADAGEPLATRPLLLAPDEVATVQQPDIVVQALPAAGDDR